METLDTFWLRIFSEFYSTSVPTKFRTSQSYSQGLYIDSCNYAANFTTNSSFMTSSWWKIEIVPSAAVPLRQTTPHRRVRLYLDDQDAIPCDLTHNLTPDYFLSCNFRSRLPVPSLPTITLQHLKHPATNTLSPWKLSMHSLKSTSHGGDNVNANPSVTANHGCNAAN
jgi:hypothetical protein